MLEKVSFLLIIISCLPFVFLGFFFAENIMTLWMGESYAGTSSLILKILLIGFIFNSLAQIPFAKIQALGKSKITALIHLGELLPYLFLLYFLCVNYGLIGAAIAWCVRVCVDFFILYFLSKE